MKEHKKFRIFFSPLNIDIVSGMIWSLDIEGIIERETCIEVYSLSSSNVTIGAIRNVMERLIAQNLIEKYEITEETIAERNWNAIWESKIDIIEISDKIVIKPSFKAYENTEGKIVLEIDPKMSFGTGEHPTTKLMVHFLEKYINESDSVLDVGSGTAVLSIAAVKLGADKALAIDNDEWCLSNGLENVSKNNCSGDVEVRLAEIGDIPEKNFDLILANINRNILIEIREAIRMKIKTGGKLILSGFTENDEDFISKNFEQSGFEKIDKRKIQDWIALVFEIKD